MPQVPETSREGDIRKALSGCSLKGILEDRPSRRACIGSEASLSLHFLRVGQEEAASGCS